MRTFIEKKKGGEGFCVMREKKKWEGVGKVDLIG